MTDKQITEALKSHPDTVTLEWMGETWHWFLGKRSFEVAQKRGVPMEQLTGALSMEEGNLGGNLEAFALLLWVGLLPFEDAPEREYVEAMLSMGDMMRLMEPITSAMGDLDVPEELLEEEAALGEDAPGKTTSGKAEAA